MEQHCISNKDINIARDSMKCHAISGLSELAKNSKSSTFLVHKLYVPSLTAESRCRTSAPFSKSVSGDEFKLDFYVTKL